MSTGSTVADGEEVSADVCVIGAGPAGLAVAAELMGSGLRVLVLESGSAQPPPGGERYGSSRSRGLPVELETSRVRGVGGSAQHWDIVTPAGGPRVRLRELDELDFEDRPGVRSPGWPLSRSSLDRYYARARELFGLPPARSDDDAPLGTSLRTRTYVFGTASTFTRTVPSRLASDPDTAVVTEAVATELHSDGPGTAVTSLSARRRDGRALTVRARRYVLAAGGVENPRLLLASRGATPGGVGNEHDQVGRWFMAHPHYGSGLVVPPDHRLRHRSDAWDLVLRNGHPVQRKYALIDEVMRREGLLNITYLLWPREPSAVVPLTPSGRHDARGLSAVRHVRKAAITRTPSPGTLRDLATLVWAVPTMGVYVARQRRAVAAETRGRHSRLPLILTLGAMAEQVPRADSRVRLNGAVDAFGVPEADVDWQVGESDGEAMRRTHDLVAPTLSTVLGARIAPLIRPGELPSLWTGDHHIGTTRMSHRPKDGVVDPDLRVHGVRNLFVAGSSVFPTAGSANPTLTIVALSMRLAELLRKELGGGP